MENLLLLSRASLLAEMDDLEAFVADRDCKP